MKEQLLEYLFKKSPVALSYHKAIFDEEGIPYDCEFLDVNNIYVSAQNHEFNPLDYINGIPHARVGQIHIAGHSVYEKYLIDTHSAPVCAPVWQLYEAAINRCGVTNTLLEWDDKIPSFSEVHREALKARQYIERHTTLPTSARAQTPTAPI